MYLYSQMASGNNLTSSILKHYSEESLITTWYNLVIPCLLHWKYAETRLWKGMHACMCSLSPSLFLFHVSSLNEYQSGNFSVKIPGRHYFNQVIKVNITSHVCQDNVVPNVIPYFTMIVGMKTQFRDKCIRFILFRLILRLSLIHFYINESFTIWLNTYPLCVMFPLYSWEGSRS